MTNEEMERAIDFILKQQAQVTSDIGRLDAAINEMRTQAEEDRRFMREVIREIAQGMAQLTVNAENDRREIRRLSEQAETDRREFRDAINSTFEFAQEIARLAASSEKRLSAQAETDRREFRDAITGTLEFAQEIARLAASSEKRLSALEGRVDKLAEG